MTGPFAQLAAHVEDALDHDWLAQARPEQLPPHGGWTTWVCLAGRGFGKTRLGCEWIRGQVEAGKISHVALIAATASDARDVLVEGPSGLLAISPNYNRPLYEPSKRRLVWPNGAIATTYSSEEPERLRGPQHAAALCDEFAAWRNIKETWDNLQFGLRIGKHPRQVITTTPKPIKLLIELVKRNGQDVIVTKGRTLDNAANLAPSFLRQVTEQYAGTRLGRQELDAEILDDVQGALWSRQLIEQSRCTHNDLPLMRRVVVAIDPAVTMREGSDETGIICAGIGTDDHYYVVEDRSGKYAPVEWSRAAISLYRRWSADRIVAEVNNGGDMVEGTIRSVAPDVSFRSVSATRGKIVRAEPVAALFEQGRAHMAGSFPELEDQLCTFEAGSTISPDRLDAMVWAISSLMDKKPKFVFG